jgi:hypothetical protein
MQPIITKTTTTTTTPTAATSEALKTFSKTLPSFIAQRDQLNAMRSNFIRRFIPIPVDSFGSPFHLRTAIPLVEKMKERNQLRFLHFNPTFLSLGDVTGLVRNGFLSVNRGGLGENAVSDELNEMKREELEKIFEKDIYDVMQINEATLLNLENVFGMEGIVNSLKTSNNHNSNNGMNSDSSSKSSSQQNDRQQYHRIWSKGRWFVAGAGKNCRPFYNTLASNNNNNTNGEKEKDTSHLFFSHESFAQELEIQFRSHGYKSRLWVPPSALPRTIAAKNGEVNRLQISYSLPKKLIPGYVLESRFVCTPDNYYERNRIGKPFHFWARTGTRVHFSEEDFAKLPKWIRMSCRNSSTSDVGNFAWFSSLDLKMFGYRVRDGEQPMINFVEERLITCVPLSPPYLSIEQLTLLDSCSSLPTPPTAQTHNNQPMIRILRNDFRWSMVPLSRVELPFDEDDAEAVKQLPLVDYKVLTSLGIFMNNNNNNNHPKTQQQQLPPLVLTMKIPVAAYNVAQLIPEEKDCDLPAPWMIVK